MHCKDFKAIWQGFADEELSPELTAQLRGHLDDCPGCQAFDRNMRSLESSLDIMGDHMEEPPPFLATRIMARIEEMQSARRGLFGWLRAPSMAIATVVAVAFVAGMFTSTAMRPDTATPALDLAQQIVIEYDGSGADKVGLVGDFNEWGLKNVPIEARKVNGRWVFQVELQPGRYQYAFVVNGKKWLPDPDAAGIIPDGFGGMNSVLYVQ